MKLIKDPMYGYIRIPKKYFEFFIDTSQFQRLIDISQVSFSSVYPSATHNRFIHSLGTYHLSYLSYALTSKKIETDFFGRIRQIGLLNDVNEVKSLWEKNKEIVKNSFFLAALLHDVGHFPYSHVLENGWDNQLEQLNFCYDDLDDFKRNHLPAHFLANKLPEKDDLLYFMSKYKSKFDTKGDKFIKDASEKWFNKIPKTHEIFGALVLLEHSKFLDHICNDIDCDIDLIVRMILGIKYIYIKEESISTQIITGLKNCFISLINSSFVDVDKLDYLMRDSFVSGYDTAVVDVSRLLEGITPYAFINKSSNEDKDNYIQNEQSAFSIEIVYNKSTISALENLLHANHYVNRWGYNHHKALYRGYAIFDSLKEYVRQTRENVKDQNKMLQDILCYEAMLEKGREVNGKSLSLISDSDIYHYIKTAYPKGIIKELISRNYKKTLWKSFDELQVILGDIIKKRDRRHYITLFDMMSELVNKENGEIPIFKKIINSLNKKFGTEFKILKCTQEYYIEKECWILFFDKVQRYKFRSTEFSLKDFGAEGKINSHFFYMYYKEATNKSLHLEPKQVLEAFIRLFNMELDKSEGNAQGFAEKVKSNL